MKQKLFLPADILLPNKQQDMTRYSVVACDQYTSEPEVWADAAEVAGDALSTLNMIFPEVYLNDGDFDGRIARINAAMEDALEKAVFTEYKESYIYIERTQRNGAVRRGIVGMVDLEGYDFAHSKDDDVQTPIRATEGTVLERIPPRVKIREHAPLELPHVMLLVDDPDKRGIEVIGRMKENFDKVYDFDLMQNSGHLTGWKVDVCAYGIIDALIERLSEEQNFYKNYGLDAQMGKKPLVFAVGDGNHSLATARQCWDNIKGSLSEEEKATHPARFALVELCNLHDEALVFEPIHRVVFDVDVKAMLEAMSRELGLGKKGSQKFTVVENGVKTEYAIRKPSSQLTVGSLQNFLDAYCKEHGGRIDYIHGEEVVERLSAQENAVGFLLSAMEKTDLYKTVIMDKALPRKTFSMGDAWDKRFYCEARRIKG